MGGEVLAQGCTEQGLSTRAFTIERVHGEVSESVIIRAPGRACWYATEHDEDGCYLPVSRSRSLPIPFETGREVACGGERAACGQTIEVCGDHFTCICDGGVSRSTESPR